MRSDAAALGALTAWGLGTQVAWRAGLGLWGAQGGDAQLWGLAAEGLRHGAPAATPPLWPLAVAGLRALGLPLGPAGWGLSLALAALVAPAVYLAARALGARRGPAVAAGLLAGGLPDLLAWGSEVQSNSMIALGLVAATGLWARARAEAETTGRPGRYGVAAAIVTGLLPAVRETGLLAAGAAVLLGPLLVPGGWRLSLGVLATWWLGPVLGGSAPGLHPLDVPWAQRADMAVLDLLGGGTSQGGGPGSGGRPPPYTNELPPGERRAYLAALQAGDALALARFHLHRTVGAAWDGLLVAAVAAVGVAAAARSRPRLRAGLLPLVVVAPTLLLWSQRRHVMLAVPALLAVGAAAAWARDRPRPRWPALVGLVVLGAALTQWPDQGRSVAAGQRGETMRARSLAGLAGWICAQEEVKLLAGPVHDVALYCPLPRHHMGHHPREQTAADWHTIFVAPAVTPASVLPAGVAPVGPRVADLQSFQLRPGTARPCDEGRVAPGTPYLSPGPVRASLVGCPSPAPPSP